MINQILYLWARLRRKTLYIDAQGGVRPTRTIEKGELIWLTYNQMDKIRKSN